MKCFASVVACVGISLLVGCQPKNPQPIDPRVNPTANPTAPSNGGTAQPTTPPRVVVARVGDAVVSQDALYQQLKTAHGFNMLMSLVQNEMVRTEARKQGITITDADIAAELERTCRKIFPEAKPEDYEAALTQLIERERGTREQFDLLMSTNAHLRELAKPIIAGNITEENLQARFRAIYGERVRIRHIEFANMQDFIAARARIQAGEDFAVVAREVSRNRSSGPRGGELKPFARHTPGLPTNFVDAAFNLQPGEVSEAVQAEGAIHLLQLIERLDPPPLAKYEDVKDSLREDMVEDLLDETIRFLRNQFAQVAMQTMVIEDPDLLAEFDRRKAAATPTVRDRDELRDNVGSKTKPTPAPAPNRAPATAPATP